MSDLLALYKAKANHPAMRGDKLEETKRIIEALEANEAALVHVGNPDMSPLVLEYPDHYHAEIGEWRDATDEDRVSYVKAWGKN